MLRLKTSIRVDLAITARLRWIVALIYWFFNP
jgi:hypothetical protein